MKSDSATGRISILFPAETSGWELWAVDPTTTFKPIAPEGLETVRASLIALPVFQVSNFLLHPPSLDKKEIRQAATLQAERLHLAKANDIPALTTTPLATARHQESPQRYRVEILDPEYTDLDWPEARFFSASPHFLPLPDNGITFWREQSHLVLAVTCQGNLTFFQSLGTSTGPSSLIRNLQSLIPLLRSANLLPTEDLKLVNWAKLPDTFCGPFNEVLPGQWHHAPRPVPQPPANDIPELPPASVQAVRHKRQISQKRRRIALAAAAVYVLVIGLWTASLLIHQAKVHRIQASLAPNVPKVEEIQDAAQTWLLLQPALEPEMYPLVLLNSIYDTLPDNHSVQLNVFEVRDKQIDLRGRASSVDLVFQLQRNLMKHPSLHGYRWNLDNPTILANNEALFRIRGEP